MAAWILNLLQEEITTLILRQTDGAAQDGNIVACFGGELANVTSNTQLVISEARGSVEEGVSVEWDPGNDRAGYFMQSKPGLLAYASWNAGAWTVRLNVTDENVELYWREVHICRVNSSGVSQESIGSNLTVDQQMDSTGTKTAKVAGAASPGALPGDTVYIVCVFENTLDFTSAGIGITPSLDVDTPLVLALPSTGGLRTPYSRMVPSRPLRLFRRR